MKENQEKLVPSKKVSPERGPPRRHPSDPPSVIQLVERRRDPRTIRQLELLLRDALAGRLIGLVAAAHYGGRDYAYAGTGSLCEHPNLGVAAAHRIATKLLHPNT